VIFASALPRVSRFGPVCPRLSAIQFPLNITPLSVQPRPPQQKTALCTPPLPPLRSAVNQVPPLIGPSPFLGLAPAMMHASPPALPKLALRPLRLPQATDTARLAAGTRRAAAHGPRRRAAPVRASGGSAPDVAVSLSSTAPRSPRTAAQKEDTWSLEEGSLESVELDQNKEQGRRCAAAAGATAVCQIAPSARTSFAAPAREGSGGPPCTCRSLKEQRCWQIA
jgi:hypothetical protein